MTRRRQHLTLDQLPRAELEALVRDLARKMGRSLYLDSDTYHAREGERVFVVRDGDPAGYYRLHVTIEGHLSCEEAAEILDSVDEGEDPIVEQSEPWTVTWAEIQFRTKAGHEIVVYNRSGEWRYVDHIVAADGRTWRFEDGCGREQHSRASNWYPSAPEVWGIPLPLRSTAAGAAAGVVSALADLLRKR